MAVGRLPLCLVRLMNDRRFPWLILVPALADATELHSLPADVRHRLMDEIAQVSTVLSQFLRPDRINVGALGNIVPQLHVHVVARFKGDAAWPGPVWGQGVSEAYDGGARAGMVDALAKRLATGGNFSADEP